MSDEESQIADLFSAIFEGSEVLEIVCSCGHTERISDLVKLEQAGEGLERYDFHCPRCNKLPEQ